MVLRHKSLTLEEKRTFILKALSYIGREYDFNFDVESDDKIVCSELAYRVFANVKFPTEQKAGRFTISPDHVAILGTGNGPFEPVLIYYDGHRLPSHLGLNLQYLLEEKYDQVH